MAAPDTRILPRSLRHWPIDGRSRFCDAVHAQPGDKMPAPCDGQLPWRAALRAAERIHVFMYAEEKWSTQAVDGSQRSYSHRSSVSWCSRGNSAARIEEDGASATTPARGANSSARNPAKVRTSGASGENRRDIHLATQTLSKTAAETKGQLSLSKQLTALQKRFAVTDHQLTQCKLELRNVRCNHERLQLEYEEMNRRCHSALAERGTAMKQLNEVKDEKNKLETCITVAVSQQGKVGVQRHAKMLETVKDLQGAKEEVESALQQANARIAQLEAELWAARSALRKREEHLGLIPVGSSAHAKANRCSVLLAVSKLETQQYALTRDKEALEAEKEALQILKSPL